VVFYSSLASSSTFSGAGFGVSAAGAASFFSSFDYSLAAGVASGSSYV